MSTLSFETYTMPAAALGTENPLAPLIPYHTPSAASAGHGSEDAAYADRGQEHHILPYRLQDQYDRQRTSRDCDSRSHPCR